MVKTTGYARSFMKKMRKRETALMCLILNKILGRFNATNKKLEPTT
jgi:hypothetical protein